MDSAYYQMLLDRVTAAQKELKRFEQAAFGDNGIDGKLFSAVIDVCLDDLNLHEELRKDLGIVRAAEFKREALQLKENRKSFHQAPGRNLPVANALFSIARLASELKAEALTREQASFNTTEPTPPQDGRCYVDPIRIHELKAAKNSKFDTTRLVRLLEELNEVAAAECWMATAMIVRAITDHIPPVFGYTAFEQVASNIPGKDRSFKGSMQHLQNSLRNIADAHLHLHIRSREVLPTRKQVEFSPDLDVLLAEVVRRLTSPP